MKTVLKYFIQNPRMLFLLDGIGAFVTSFSLFFILPNLEGYFAMPVDILFALSIIAAIFCLYSGWGYYFLKDNWSAYIKVIMVANSLYCVITTLFIVTYFPVLTRLDLIYFVGELLIISILVFIEFSVARMVQRWDRVCNLICFNFQLADMFNWWFSIAFCRLSSLLIIENCFDAGCCFVILNANGFNALPL